MVLRAKAVDARAPCKIGCKKEKQLQGNAKHRKPNFLPLNGEESSNSLHLKVSLTGTAFRRVLELKQRRFWATHVDWKWEKKWKWAFSLFICLDANKFVLQNFNQTTAQWCKKSTSGWRPSLSLFVCRWLRAVFLLLENLWGSALNCADVSALFATRGFAPQILTYSNRSEICVCRPKLPPLPNVDFIHSSQRCVKSPSIAMSLVSDLVILDVCFSSLILHE